MLIMATYARTGRGEIGERANHANSFNGRKNQTATCLHLLKRCHLRRIKEV